MEWPDWDEEGLAEFLADWRRALNWGRDWQAAERQSAELLGLPPEQPEALAGEPEEGPSLADWRLLLGAGRAAERALPGGGRIGGKQRADYAGRRQIGNNGLQAAAFAKQGNSLQTPEFFKRKKAAVRQPVQTGRNERPEPGLPEIDRQLEVVRMQQFEESGLREPEVKETAAERQKPLRVNLGRHLATNSQKTEQAAKTGAGEAVWAGRTAAGAEIGETADGLRLAADFEKWPEPAAVDGPGRQAADWDWAEEAAAVKAADERTRQETTAVKAADEQTRQEAAAADVDALAEAVAELLCAEIEAQLGSSSFIE